MIAMESDREEKAKLLGHRMVAGPHHVGLVSTMAEYLEGEMARLAAIPKLGANRPYEPPTRDRGAPVQSTDYPWLRADWIEAPVEPLRLRNKLQGRPGAGRARPRRD